MSNLNKFRADEDLMFLEDVSGEDLKILADTLIYDVAGDEQWTGNLKNLLDKLKNSYGSDPNLHKDNWKAIAAELQLFGGDSTVNLLRRKGVHYKVMLEDILKYTGTDYNFAEGIEKTEERLLRTLFGKITTLEDIKYIYEILENKGYFPVASLMKDPIKAIKNIHNTQSAAKSGGTKGLFGVGVAVAAQVASKLNPVTAGASLVLPLAALTGPAYRITIPAVCVVSMLRIKYNEGLYD